MEQIWTGFGGIGYAALVLLALLRISNLDHLARQYSIFLTQVYATKIETVNWKFAINFPI